MIPGQPPQPTDTTAPPPYPVRVEGKLEPVSRWLWLVKWLLAIPHYFLLFFLWLAFFVLTVVAFFAILFTGRYPREIFVFNVGVLRWSWRVQFYAYSALGTDRYPPFTLADVPDYPARLDVDYPERLSRGLVLVKWWLLAIPQYILVGLFAGGGAWFLGADGFGARYGGGFNWAAGGLIGVLILVAAIVLLFTGNYPRSIFDFVVGLDRWVIRVGAYAGLMTDRYPPFRLDMGERDPGGPVSREALKAPGEPAGPVAGHEWTGGRIASVIVGSVLALAAMGLITGGATALWANGPGRDDDGYLTASQTFTVPGYALTSGEIQLAGPGSDWGPLPADAGDVRVRARNLDSSEPVFLGIAPAAAVERYLSTVNHATVRNFGTGTVDVHSGTQVPAPPQGVNIWFAQTVGFGTQTLNWRAVPGDWTIVVMNADGTRPLNVLVEPGATVPDLGWAGTWVLVSGIVVLAGGVALISVPAHRAARVRSAEKV